MKKYFILLSLILVFILSGCQEIERPVSFSVESGYRITQYEGQSLVNLGVIKAYDFDNVDITTFIYITGNYDLNIPGEYTLNLSVTDAVGTIGNIEVTLVIFEITCAIDNTQEKCIVHVESLQFNKNTNNITTVFIDDFVKLNYNILPLNAKNQEVLISSSNNLIATVNEYGYVFAKGIGEVTITFTATDGGISISKVINIIEKTCDDDPLQDKCAIDILGDNGRVTTLNDSNLSGLDYTTIYRNNKIYYQIYVRTFADSDGNYKGDFRGILNNLQYLKELGIGGIWLMPINESRSDHGYEVDDYYDVDSEYGTMIDFEELLSASDLIGIDIIIDLVINHMGARNDIFQDVLKNGISSQYYDWFNWLDTSNPRSEYKGSWGQTIWYNPTNRDWLKGSTFTIHSSLSNKVYCAYFSDWMPDLNLENPEVRQYLKDVGKFWLDKGVDGFRMDATSHFYGLNEHFGLDNNQENINFLTDYNAYLLTVDPDVYVVVEAWEGYQTYAQYYSAGVSAFNFQANYDIKSAVSNYLAEDIGNALNRVYNYIKNYDVDFIDAVFLSNHDAIGRIAGQTGSFVETRQAAEILLTLPGNPFIYYGDEVGILGGRTNMIWGDYYEGLTIKSPDLGIDTVSTQLGDQDSLLNRYIDLGTVRNTSLALSYGSFIPYSSSDLEGYYRIFENGNDKEIVVVLFNFTNSYYIPIPEQFTSYEILYNTYDSNLGGISPNSTVILRLPWDLQPN